MNKKLLRVLACPLCNGELIHSHTAEEELICRSCGLAFPVRDDIPVMLENEARTLTTDERLKKEK